LCVENSGSGQEFLRWLNQLTEIDPNYIQFGCAEWFWERSQNSYLLQVEPVEHMFEDECSIDFQEALHIEKVRNMFYDSLMMLVSNINRP